MLRRSLVLLFLVILCGKLQGFRLLPHGRTLRAISRLSDAKESGDLCAEVRADFPLLSTQTQTHRQTHTGRRLVYLDSAATSQKPTAVLDALQAFYRESNANVHRGAYSLAHSATEAYELARERVRSFINAQRCEEVVFTRGATEAINLVALSFGAGLRAGDEVLCTVCAHHSNLVPWQMLAQRTGATLRFVDIDASGALDLDQLRALLSERTRLVAVTHVSNVLGAENDVKEIVRESRRVGAAVLLDGCQSLPHLAVDVQALDVDFFAASGHKLCGPMGCGFLFAKRERLRAMPPVFGGGEMVDQVDLQSSTYAPAPLRFEAGTPSVADAVGLGVACEYLRAIGMQRIAQHSRELCAYLLNELQSRIDGVTVYGPQDESRTSLVSFNVAQCHAADLAFFLDQEGICVRAGSHCAQPLHRRLGVTGSLRASLYLYNDKEDVDFFVSKLQEVVKMLRKF